MLLMYMSCDTDLLPLGARQYDYYWNFIPSREVESDRKGTFCLFFYKRTYLPNLPGIILIKIKKGEKSVDN